MSTRAVLVTTMLVSAILVLVMFPKAPLYAIAYALVALGGR